MQFQQKNKSEESINLTPLIDVVFLLLIFFMVSTTFTKETHLQLSLPEAEGELQPEVPTQIEVVVNASGGYSVNGQGLINKQLNTLLAAIEKVGEGKTDIPFLITADANVPYQSVVTAMDAAGRLGYVNISMTTQKPGAEQ